MKFVQAEDDEVVSNRRISENGIVQIVVYPVMYGHRVRIGFCSDPWFYHLDWCGGGNWKDVERLYSIALGILSLREETENCFDDLPTKSSIKPFYLDDDFIKIITEKAGDFQLIELIKPERKPNPLYDLFTS